MEKGDSDPKPKLVCVMKSCQNIRYLDNLLCFNHWIIRDKLYSYRYKYGDLKKKIKDFKKSGIPFTSV